MIPNMAGGALQSPLSGGGHAHSDGASAAPATESSAATASASLASSSVAGSASAASASAIPRISLHLLGTDSAACSITPDAASPPFVAIPGNDELSIIAGYLSQDDQLGMRDIAASVRAVVDPTIHTLKFSSREACATLRQPNALRNLRELHLTDCKDEDLIDLAAMLAEMPIIDFGLIVEAGLFGRHRVTADGIRPLAALGLTGLTLKGIPVPVDMSRALVLSVSPLSINLPYLDDYQSNVYELSQIPMLHSLQVGVAKMLTPETIEALRTHAALETLHLNTVSGKAISILATSEHIRSLTVANIIDGEIAALNALADNHVLTSLSLGVNDANALAALSRNVTLQKLSISVAHIPPALLSSFASMPALEHFQLSRRGQAAVSITVDGIAALCAKPLHALSFYEVHMDSATRSRLATAQTTSLRLQFCTSFESEDFAAFSHNRSITSLFMMNDRLNNNDDDILSLVTSGLPQLESLYVDVGSGAPNIAKEVIQAAWTASGRQLSNLDMDVRYVSVNPNDGYDSDDY